MAWLQSTDSYFFGANIQTQSKWVSDSLIVINEDRVSPSKGFGTMVMKIWKLFPYVIKGALSGNKDSMVTVQLFPIW